MERVVSFEQALEIVAAAAARPTMQRGAPRVERVPLLAAAGRVLAEAVTADRDQPPFDRSTRDGFAVRAAELTHGPLRVVGQVQAGKLWPDDMLPGTAISIMTGAPIPRGADAVVMVEHVTLTGDSLQLTPGRRLNTAENIVPRGAEAVRGATVIPAGTRVDAAAIALAATSGLAELPVFTRPLVAICATGDELVELAEAPEPQQIRNSNSYALAAMATAAGAHAARLPIARDLRDDVRERIAQGRMHDLLLLSGGVSMGEYDLVESVLEEFGAEFFFTGVRMQPGKPVVFGRLPARQHPPLGTPELECYFFGLPGNPISTQVTFHCFAEPFLRALAGTPYTGPRWAQATLAKPVPARPGVTRLLPANMQGVTVTVVPWQGSGDLAANARANCYAELLPERDYAAGDILRILLR